MTKLLSRLLWFPSALFLTFAMFLRSDGPKFTAVEVSAARRISTVGLGMPMEGIVSEFVAPTASDSLATKMLQNPAVHDTDDGWRMVAILLQRAVADLKRGNLPMCRRRLDRIERIDPEYPVVPWIRSIVEQCAVYKTPPLEDQLRLLTSELDEGHPVTRIPMLESLRMPQGERSRIVREEFVDDNLIDYYDEALCYSRVSAIFSGATVVEVVEVLREISGLNLKLDTRVLPWIIREKNCVTMQIGDIALSGAIKLALHRVVPDLCLDVRSDGEILITGKYLR